VLYVVFELAQRLQLSSPLLQSLLPKPSSPLPSLQQTLSLLLRRQKRRLRRRLMRRLRSASRRGSAAGTAAGAGVEAAVATAVLGTLQASSRACSLINIQEIACSAICLLDSIACMSQIFHHASRLAL
jgi:hypothetical protein